MAAILLISYSGALGGAERVLLDFAPALPGAICLACPEGPLASAARRRGIRVFPLRTRKLDVRSTLRNRLLAAPRLAGHAREVRGLALNLDPDLIIVWGMRSVIAWMLAGVRRSPVVFAHHDLPPGSMIGKVVRAAAARADLVVTPSKAVAEDLGRLVRKPAVVHPGVDVNGIAPEWEFDREASSPSTAARSGAEVLVLGALVGWKRPDIALEACALARRRFPDVRLRFVGSPLEGDNGLLARLRERASRPDLAGAVEFAGPVDDPRPALARATCLLHCASREPFGLAVLEALAAGRPVIVPASAGPSEIVDESCGILYRPGDAASAADGLLALLSNPERAAQMGARGRARARERFDSSAARARFAAAVAPLVRPAPAVPVAPDTLALLTVTHNSAPELATLLGSVERHLPGVRVVVVDCASADETLDVASGRDHVASVALAENVGFGRACNRGLLEIHEPVTVLVNPDVELLDSSLFELATEALQRRQTERLLAPLVLCTDGSRQDTVHPVPGSPADLVRSFVPPAAVPGSLGIPLAPWRARSPRRVGWAVGCALAARTDTLRRLGPFDERIFLYAEDLELGLRAASSGVETWFCPSTRLLHHRAHSSRVAFGGEPFELRAQARRAVVQRRLGHRRGHLDDAAQAATFATRIALKRALGRAAARERQQLAALVRVRRTGTQGEVPAAEPDGLPTQ